MSERNPRIRGEDPNIGGFMAGLLAPVVVVGLVLEGAHFVHHQADHPEAASVSAPTPDAKHVQPADNTPTHPASHPPKPRASTFPKIVVPSETPTPTPTPTATKAATPKPPKAAEAPLIVLDPGHSGKIIRPHDPATGLWMYDYPNYPEISEVFHVTQMVQQELVHDGYRVLMTKSKVSDSPTYHQRAELATKNRAALEVIIHDDHASPLTEEWVTPQAVGGYRIGTEGKISCENRQVVHESVLAAEAIAKARTAAMPKYPTILHQIPFTNRGPKFSPGTLSQIQLMTCIDKQYPVPTVYDEMGAKPGTSTTAPVPESRLEAYATGLVNGIEAAVPLT